MRKATLGHMRRTIQRGLKKFVGLGEQKKFGGVWLTAFAVIIGAAGLIIILSRAAPTPPTVYITPATTTVGLSTAFTVQVRENSGTTGVNAIQANLSYPSSLLTCTTIDTATSAFGVQAQSSCSGGQITIARGVSGGAAPLIGDQLVATLTFTAGTTSGSAAVAFSSGTALVSASTNQDILGSLSATAGGTYTIDGVAPTVSIAAPANNQSLAYGSSTTITVNATDAQSAVSKVDVYIDGSLKTTLTSAPYSYAWTGAAMGSHTIQAKATDAFNNVGSSSTVTVTVSDQTPPTVAMTAPAAGALVSGTTVSLSATAADNIKVASVQFRLDGANVGSLLTTSPYTFVWSTVGVSDGSHSLTAVAKDAAGNATTASPVTITVDNAAPTVSITAPSSSTTLTGTTTVAATATDNTGGSGIAKVELYVDGVLTATALAPPYTFSWNTAAASFGGHTLTVKVYDKTTPANTATSAGIAVNVDNAISGDINGDGKVDVLDLSTLLSHYGATSSASDLNHDGLVNVLDLSILLSHFGQ